jgi:hypothetical protein
MEEEAAGATVFDTLDVIVDGMTKRRDARATGKRFFPVAWLRASGRTGFLASLAVRS